LAFLGLALLLAALAAMKPAESAAADPDRPPGSLVIAGGGELPEPVAERFVELAGGKASRVVVIPTATEMADTPELLPCPGYWRARGAGSVGLLHTRNRERANDPAFVQPLTEATGVWFSGGDQEQLLEAYGGTRVEQELQKVLARGGVIGGTSAGAAALSHVMILGGNPHARVGTGFDFLRDVVIDTHFQNRQRLGRLLGVLAEHPRCAGLGIDEDTALVLAGGTITVFGGGNVRVCLPALGKEASRVQVLHAGDHVNLAALDRMVLTRVQAAAADRAPGARPALAGLAP
jgi:cyanophycinase